MTHDPLCYRSHDQTLGRDAFCQCDAIAKARDDALDAAHEAVAAINGKWVFGPRIYKHQALHAIRLLRKGDQP